MRPLLRLILFSLSAVLSIASAAAVQLPEAPVLDLESFYERNSGTNLTLDATPTRGYPASYTYQWSFKAVGSSSFLTILGNFGGTASSYQINGTTDNNGTWKIEVTNDTGTTTHEFEYRVYADADGDGLSDYQEVAIYGTDPNLADTDGDGLNDDTEINTHNTDPNLSDTDGDGLSDGDEVNTYKTDPLSADSSGDGLSDGDVVAAGFDPTVDYSNLASAAAETMVEARPGLTRIDLSGGKARITMTLEETSDLSDWSTPTKTDHTIEIDAPAQARFYRFKMQE